VSLRVVASAPTTAGLFRLDQMIAALARERLWLTDAYFIPVTPYVGALRAAARDGVDVRILVPGASDLVLISALSRAGYRPLLEAGVRIFEWNGTMLHAKTAVADTRWARVGSTNLNLASFVGNFELDVAIDDAGVAREMEEMYQQDLEQATEVVLEVRRWRVRPRLSGGPEREAPTRRAKSGSAGRAAAGALRIGSAVGNAIAKPREVGYGEGRMIAAAGLLLVALAGIAVQWPRAVAWPFAALAVWFGLAVLVHAWRGYRAVRRSAADRRT
jgi:cardiolipin synthase